MLLGVGRGTHEARIEQRADRLLVRPIRRSEGNGDGNAGGVGEVMALGAALGAVGRIGAGFFPRPAGLCAATHRQTATSTRSRRPRHSAGADGARSLPRCRARPSAGTAGATSSHSRTPAARLSTDNPCARRRERRRESGAAASTDDPQSAETPRRETGSRSDSTARRAPSKSSVHFAAASAPPSPPLHGVLHQDAKRGRTTRRGGDPALPHLWDRLLRSPGVPGGPMKARKPAPPGSPLGH